MAEIESRPVMMMDIVSVQKRREMMSGVKNKNTSIELTVRKCLHSLGFRYRLHARTLPGKPDLVLKKHNLCIFVNGCFWHQHPGCKKATIPATNREFWSEKLRQNVNRDKKTKAALEELGWKVLVIWECQTKQTETLLEALSKGLPTRTI